jgi:hypothetical protein
MEWKGFDVAANYRIAAADLPLIGGNYGEFNFGVDATYVTTYDYTSFTGVTVEGAGKRNNRVAAVPPTPELKANLRLAWNLNNHQVTIFGRYLDGVDKADDGDPVCSSSPFVINVFFPGLGVTNPCRKTLPSYTTWDLQYSVAIDSLIGDQETVVQVGLINAFDKEAPALVTLGGLETNLYDPRGQTWYIRVKQGF